MNARWMGGCTHGAYGLDEPYFRGLGGLFGSHRFRWYSGLFGIGIGTRGVIN